MPIAINGTGTISGVSATGIDAVQNLPATGSFTTLGVTGNLSFNSGFGSSAVAYGCRAWVNFNGTGTVAIRASGNVSSITDNGVGSYIVNFANALPDTSYSAVASSAVFTSDGIGSNVRSTTQCTVLNVDSRTYGFQDSASIYFAVFR